MENLGVEGQRRLAHLLAHIHQQGAVYQGGVVVHPVHHIGESADGGDGRFPGGESRYRPRRGGPGGPGMYKGGREARRLSCTTNSW